MAYTPKTWVTGETIEAADLNHMEQGIAAVDQSAAEAQETADEAQAIVAGEFLTTKTYTTGEYCIYSGALYRFTADKTAGAWDSTKVVAVALADDVNDLKSEMNEIAENVEPTNLFNKNSNLIKSNYRVAYSGDYISLSGSSVTHPIKIEAGKKYCFSFSGSYYGDEANKIVRYCKADGTLLLDHAQYANVNTSGTHYGYFTALDYSQYGEYTYVCVNVRSTLLSSMIFAEGETLPSYSEYFDPYWQIKESAIPDDLPLPANAQNNILYGKKAAFCGDSICYGAGFSGGYPKIIGENNGMTISNTAQTGATLATGTTVDGVNRGWISAKVANMPANYDYYIVEGGVNDASGDVGVQLGTLSSGYTATLDTTTLYGAMEQICKTLQTTFIGKKYGFLIPHNCYGQTHRWNTEFRPAIKECCKKWGIPYLDLSDKTAQLNNISALRVYTKNSDGWHPTEDGYKLFYVDKIEAWMKTL